MDPDACLRELRDAIANARYIRAAHLFEDLDEWLQRGGFPPAEWSGSWPNPKIGPANGR